MCEVEAIAFLKRFEHATDDAGEDLAYLSVVGWLFEDACRKQVDVLQPATSLQPAYNQPTTSLQPACSQPTASLQAANNQPTCSLQPACIQPQPACKQPTTNRQPAYNQPANSLQTAYRYNLQLTCNQLAIRRISCCHFASRARAQGDLLLQNINDPFCSCVQYTYYGGWYRHASQRSQVVRTHGRRRLVRTSPFSRCCCWSRRSRAVRRVRLPAETYHPRAGHTLAARDRSLVT